ncbi:UNVERIFIED_CONTAM: hypothetical protein FKN15_041878 [Acipenser sinensis]
MEAGGQDENTAQCSDERHSKWDFVTDEMRDLTLQINQQLPLLTDRKNGSSVQEPIPPTRLPLRRACRGIR